MGTMWRWYSGTGIFLAGLALPLILGRVPPNYWYGFRTSRTMNSTALWYAANRYAGWRLLAAGAAIVASAQIGLWMPGLDVDTYSWLCAVVALSALTFATLQSLWFTNRHSEAPMYTEFAIVPAGSSTVISAAVIALLLLGVAGLALSPAYGSRNIRYQISSSGLRVAGDLYGRLVPAASIQAAAMRPVDFALEPQLQSRWRVNGIAIPGYKSGWFKLTNGEWGLLFITDPQRVALVPTSAGYSVLLSVADPQQFVAALRAALAQP